MRDEVSMAKITLGLTGVAECFRDINTRTELRRDGFWPRQDRASITPRTTRPYFIDSIS